jgi:hypothetical protein
MVKAAGHEIRVLRGGAATYRTVRDEIARGVYDIVHVAGHGWFDDRGTILYLHDGRVNASELVTLLAGRPPALLIVSSHYSGLVPAFCDAFPVEFPVSGSYEDFYRKMRGSRPGLERAAARAGVGAYIGCMGSPTDDAAAAVDDGDGVILLTDMFGGTPSNLAISVMEQTHAEVIAGLNLPMLIKLASVRGRETLEACVAHAQDAGRKYISVASWVLAGEK